MPIRLHNIADSRAFQHFVIGVIFLSAILAGLEAAPRLHQDYGRGMEWIEAGILAIFTLEILIRIGACGPALWRFFASGWNVFDFLIVALCFLPATHFLVVLRFVRVLRVLRLVAPLYESELVRQKNRELAAAYQALEAEKTKSERLLLNVLPMLIARRLRNDTRIIADSFPEATVLFADLVGFTEFSNGIAPEALVAILDAIFSRFDQLVDRHGLEKIKTIGDAYMVVAGVPEPRSDHLEAMAALALAMQAELEDYNRATGHRFSARIGIHTGPVVAGVIGRKKFIYDLWGDTVNTASRMESHCLPGKIQVTHGTCQRLRERYSFADRGTIEIKGKGSMRTCFLTGKIAADDAK